MSAAGRFALFISGLVAATSLLSSRTALDATKSPGSAPVWMAVEKPPAMPVEPTVVTLAEHSEWRPVSLGLPRAPLDREAIVRQLQSELKRVGCYASEPNGIWTTSTRRAMQVFVERVTLCFRLSSPTASCWRSCRGIKERPAVHRAQLGRASAAMVGAFQMPS